MGRGVINWMVFVGIATFVHTCNLVNTKKELFIPSNVKRKNNFLCLENLLINQNLYKYISLSCHRRSCSTNTPLIYQQKMRKSAFFV